MFDFLDDFDMLDIGVLGGLGEELAGEERERRKIEDDWNKDQEDEDNF